MTNPQVENGCIFLSRSILNSKVFRNEKWLKVWIWCLLKANHKEISLAVKTGKGNTVIKIKRGQFLYGRHSASRALDMPPSTIRNIIAFLVRWENLTIKADTHYSIITVLNYDTYQDINTYRRTGKRTTKGQPKDTNNNDKNDNNIYMCGFDEFWKVYPSRNGRKQGKKESRDIFVKIREEELENVVRAVKNYAESKDVQNGIGIRDPKRFLKDNYWKEWVDASRAKRFDEIGH
jgi:hypothetical protein|tara:strand:+ start:1616 stop:2317 length:702 start_codon:yes stop_codon:yes gene_type:complete